MSLVRDVGVDRNVLPNTQLGSALLQGVAGYAVRGCGCGRHRQYVLAYPALAARTSRQQCRLASRYLSYQPALGLYVECMAETKLGGLKDETYLAPQYTHVAQCIVSCVACTSRRRLSTAGHPYGRHALPWGWEARDKHMATEQVSGGTFCNLHVRQGRSRMSPVGPVAVFGDACLRLHEDQVPSNNGTAVVWIGQYAKCNCTRHLAVMCVG